MIFWDKCTFAVGMPRRNALPLIGRLNRLSVFVVAIGACGFSYAEEGVLKRKENIISIRQGKGTD